jgi:hypothetical protein
LENKENKLKNNCEILSKQLDKHRETLPLAELIETMHIGRSELISFRVAINGASELYGFPPSTAAFHVINNIRDYNKKANSKRNCLHYTCRNILLKKSYPAIAKFYQL